MKRGIKKFAVDLHIRVGYGTAFLLLLLSYLLTLYANSELLKQSRLVNHSNAATVNLEGLISSLNIITITSLAIGILMAVYGFITYSRENRARRVADLRVSDYQDQLKERILELDKANKELIQMRSTEKFAATGRIARTIAHEIRNPLTNINLAVDQLKAGQNSGEDSGLMHEMIGRNSERINQLITDLLNSTKFTDLIHKKMSINQILDETLELARDRIMLNAITVTKKYSSDICDVSVDVERIKIAFLNIIVNAIEAMEPGKGVLLLTTAGKDDKCVVTITDNGLGIDQESLSKLFEPYFTSKPKGTGLGLTNTQNIILNHNGHITIESEKGKGASFTITLDFA
jgi:signal transduction histidine kinase